MTTKQQKISKKRQRKIEHLRSCVGQGYSRAQLVNKGLHHMNMSSDDVQVALGGQIYSCHPLFSAAQRLVVWATYERQVT